MNVDELLNRGGVPIPNPNYSKSKKNKEPKYLITQDLDNLTDFGSALAEIGYNATQRGYTDILGDSKENEKYYKYNIDPKAQDRDLLLADAQSNWKKLGNSLAQTLVSEIGLGTLKGVSDLFDFVGQAIGVSDKNYSNPISQFLEEKQEEFRNFAPIYRDETKNISNGGLGDFGWWMANMPSIASSLTLLLPAAYTTKLLSMAGKATNLGKFTRSAIRGMTGGNKVLQEGEQLGKFATWANKPSTIAGGNLFLENGMTAAMSRTMENYQEARQTYNDMYAQASDHFRNMKDEDYQKVVNDNQELIKEKGIDPNNKDEVAKAIAGKAADVTFQTDFGNVVFDVIELYALRNAWKGFFSREGNLSAKNWRANKDQMKFPGKSPEEIAALKADYKWTQKAGEWLTDRAYGARSSIVGELSEGVEEALNYVAQEEGMTYGNVLLGKTKGDKEKHVLRNMFNGFDGRLEKYLQAPELYDAAFWGVLGGVVFQGLGSKFNEIKSKIGEKKSEANKESQQSMPWYELINLTEDKRKLKEIQSRGIDMVTLKNNVEKINKGIDPFQSTEGKEVKFTSEEERERARQTLLDKFVADMTIRSMHAGTTDMLKEYFRNENVRKGMVEMGIFDRENDTRSVQEKDVEAQQFVDAVSRRIEEIENQYNQELITVNNAAAQIHKDNPWGGYIPAEYIQIVATNNVYSALNLRSTNQALGRIDTRIGELKSQLEESGDLDTNVEHQENVRLAVFAYQLGILRAQRRELAKDTKSLTNRFAIEDIDKKINMIESKIQDEAALRYATYMSLRFVMNPDGKTYDQVETKESFKYKDEMITKRATKAGDIFQLLGREVVGLSDRALTAMSDEQLQSYKILEQDANITYRELNKNNVANQNKKDKVAELDKLYQTRAAYEISADYDRLNIARTDGKVEEAIGNLHNAMSQARVDAIKQANDIILDLYDTKADDVRAYIDSKVFGQETFDEENTTLTSDEIAKLDDALKVLALTKNYNRSLGAKLDGMFKFIDDVKAAQEEENATNKNGSQPSNNQWSNNNTPQPQNGNTQAPSQPQGQPQGTNNQQQNQNNYKINIDNAGKITVSDKGTNDAEAITLVPVGSDGFRLNPNQNKSILTNPDLFNQDVILSDDYEITELPLVKLDNGELIVQKQGTIENVNSNNKITDEKGNELKVGDTIGFYTPFGDVTKTITKINNDGSLEVIEENGESNTILAKDVKNYTKVNINENATSNPSTGEGVQPSSSSSSQPNQSSSLQVGDKVKLPGDTIATVLDISGNMVKVKSDTTGNILFYSSNKLTKVTPEQTPIVSPTNNQEDSNVEQIVQQFSSEDVIFRESSRDLTQAWLADKTIDLDAKVKELVDDYVNQGIDRVAVEQAVNKARASLQKLVDRYNNANQPQTLASTVNELTISQSLQGTNLANNNIVAAYADVVNRMLDLYTKEFGIEPVNGVQYINLEYLLRHINNITNDKSMASLIYDSLIKYLNNEEIKKKYRIIDEANANSETFLSDVAKSAQERYLEKIQDSSIQRVDTRSFVAEMNDTEREAFYKALDELQPGDKLQTSVNGYNIIIKDSQGRLVGRLPVPTIMSNGGFKVINDGWNIDVVRGQGGAVFSSLKDLFERWFMPSDAASKEIYDIVLEAAYNKLTDERKNELINKFLNNKEFKDAEAKGYIGKNATPNQLLNGLVKLMRFTKTIQNPDAIDEQAALLESLDMWFDKLMDSYETVRAIAAGQPYDISVNRISDGELIQISNEKGMGIKTAIPADQALAGGVNTAIHKIAIVDPQVPDMMTASGMPLLNAVGFSKNATYVVIPNRSGTHGYAQAYPANLDADFISKDAQEIVKAVKTKLCDLISDFRKHPSTPAFEEISKFVNSILGQRNGNTSMFYGLTTTITQNSITIAEKGTPNKITIYKLRNERDFATELTIGNQDFEVSYTGQDGFQYRTKNFAINDRQSWEKEVSKILDKAHFNIRPTYINSDSNPNVVLQGIASREGDEFVIRVGDKVWKYPTYNDFILKNNLVRLNTKPNDNGTSNFNRAAERVQQNNQIFEIKIVSSSTSPVEDSNATQPTNQPTTIPTNISINDKVQAILESDSNNKGYEIVKTVLGTDSSFTKESLKQLEKWDLLPKSINFDPEYNNREGYAEKNASINPRTGEVTVGTVWWNQFKNANDRNRAIRILIHEQLHHLIYKNKANVRTIQGIYDEFVQAVNSGVLVGKKRTAVINGQRVETVPFDNEDLKKFFFEGDPNALEEFIIESITNRDLADALNAIDAKVDNRKRGRTLFQRIVNFLTDIFNWGVRRNSLYEKELNTLRDFFNEIDNATENQVQEEQTKKQGEQKVEDTTTKEPVVETKPQEQQAPETPTSKNGRDFSREFDDEFDSSVTETITDYTPEMNSIKQQAIANGTFMKAHNGNPTNLNERQWLQVRTKNFINWFGDWINNPSEASQVIDENGEPLVVYHGAKSVFTIFDVTKSDSRQFLSKQINPTNFFSDDKTVADFFAISEKQSLASAISRSINVVLDALTGEDVSEEEIDRYIWEEAAKRTGKTPEYCKQFWENEVPSEYKMYDDWGNSRMEDKDTDNYKYSVFLNMKNPIIIDAKGERADKIIENNKDILNNNDEVIIKNINETVGKKETATDYIVRKSNNIKSATNNTGDFSATNDDIRYSSATEIATNIPSVSAMQDRLPLSIQSNFASLVKSAEISLSCK